MLAAPWPRSALTLAPGERAEVLVNFGLARSGQVTRLLASTAGGGMGMRMGSGMGTGSDTEVTALTMRVDRPSQPGAMASPPTWLSPAAAISAGPGATVRNLQP